MSFRSLLDRLNPLKPQAAGNWKAPRALDQGPVGGPHIAMDDQGNALAAWHHRSSSSESVYICRYHAQDGNWDLVPRRLDSTLSDAKEPEVAMNGRGEIAVLWHQDSDGQAQICARHFLGNAETWVPYPMALMTAPGKTSGLQCAMDPSGNITAVWVHSLGREHRILASRYDGRQGSWQSSPVVLGPASEDLLHPKLAVNRQGSVLVVWSAFHDTMGGLYASYCTLGEWSEQPIRIAQGFSRTHHLAMDERGNAILLWVSQERGADQQLKASHMDPRTLTWRTSSALATSPAIQLPQVGMDAQGNAWAVWRQEGAGASKLFARRFHQSQWEPRPVALDPELGNSLTHSLSVSAQGHAAVVWSQNRGGQSSLFARRFRGGAWDPNPVMLGQPSPKMVQFPGAFIAPNGSVAAIWRQGSASEGSIMSAVAT
jgi:hypothetical protein